MSKPEQIWTSCSGCDRDTRHSVLLESTKNEYDYRAEILHQIIQCCGCETKSFRKVSRWLEEAYQVDEDQWEVPETVVRYPTILQGHRAVPEIERAPEIVESIYRQSLDAIKSQSSILAGIGLRATIEAICNEQGVTGRSLESRIDKLAKAGSISTNDANRLHAIRFLGNDAAHEIQPADTKSLLVALRIVEHLILNLYILDHDADGILETVIKTYTEFEKLLSAKLATATKGDEVPLAKLLGRDARRFHGYLKSHETQLISNIAAGTYTLVTLGKLASYNGSREKFQHFIVA